MIPNTESSQNWVEDYKSHGIYLNACRKCGDTFYGCKHRTQCKWCYGYPGWRHRLASIFGGTIHQNGTTAHYYGSLWSWFSNTWYNIKKWFTLRYYDTKILYYKTKIRIKSKL